MMTVRPESSDRADGEQLTPDGVVSLCRQILGTNDLNAADNFFDAGGDSLLAMRLVLEVEKQLGMKLSLDTIYSVPTIGEISGSLHGEDRSRRAAVLPLKPGSNPRTLYYIHSAFEFSGLNNALLSDIATALVTINDLQRARELIDRHGILTAIDQISDSYAQAIYEEEEGGPGYLAGHSFGGVFAIETARKLEDRGAAPGIVFLFDTYLHGSMRRGFHNLLHNRALADKALQSLSGIRALFDRIQKGPLSQPVVPAESADTEWGSVFDELRDTGSRLYKGPPSPLRSQTVLFQATQSRGGRPLIRDESLGWAATLKPNLTVIASPGDHFSLLTASNADFIAQEIEHQIGLQR